MLMRLGSRVPLAKSSPAAGNPGRRAIAVFDMDAAAGAMGERAAGAMGDTAVGAMGDTAVGATSCARGAAVADGAVTAALPPVLRPNDATRNEAHPARPRRTLTDITASRAAAARRGGVECGGLELDDATRAAARPAIQSRTVI